MALSCLYLPVITGKVALLWDTYDYSYPLALYLKDSFAAGIWPLWNPFILSGEALLAQPAVSAYHPLHLLIAIAPDFIDSFHLLQLLLVALTVVGAFGFHRFLRTLGFGIFAATFGATVFGATSFGPLLGQMPIAFGIALFPWLADAVYRMCHQTRFEWRSISTLSLLGALFIYGAYFGVLLYSICFFAGLIPYAVLCSEKRNIKALIANFGASAVLAVLLASPHLFSAAENRKYFYSTVSNDFLSPDPRVRGVTLPRDHIVEIIPNERTLLGVLSGSRELAKDGAFWVIGPGLAVLVLALFSLTQIRRRRVLATWIAFGLAVSYLLGPRSAVFEFVYKFVPLLNNIRYPVFSFPFVMMFFIFLALVTLERMTEKLPRKWAIGLVTGLCFESILFSWNSGLFDDRSPAIAKSVSSQEIQKLSLLDRKRSVQFASNDRQIRATEILDFASKDWISRKTPSNQGYSTSDSPFYWYLKSDSFLSQLAYCPIRVITREGPTILTNSSMKAAQDEIVRLPNDTVITNQNLIDLHPCTVNDLYVEPNRASINVETDASSLLAFTDKDYPGWTASIGGASVPIVKVNHLFKGVVIPKGRHVVEFRFAPEKFYLGLRLAILALLTIATGFVFEMFKRRRAKAPAEPAA